MHILLWFFKLKTLFSGYMCEHKKWLRVVWRVSRIGLYAAGAIDRFQFVGMHYVVVLVTATD